MQQAPKKLIILTGPTGIGKTDLSIQLAQWLNSPIISADSRQVYQELSIGTAVPDQKQLQAVKHFMVQNKSIHQYYSAGIFELEVIDLLKKIYQNQNVAMLVGGSGMYIDAVCYGIDDIPDIDPDIRNKLIERWQTEGIEALKEELLSIDPEYYHTADLRNPKRVLKGLEVFYTSGKKYSSFLKSENKQRDFDFLKIALNIDRFELYNRINSRVDRMMEQGLLSEVKQFFDFRNLNSLNTVGYKELFAYLNGDSDLETAVDLIKRNSRRYAKRQISWINRDKTVQWFQPNQIGEIKTAITQFIQTH